MKHTKIQGKKGFNIENLTILYKGLLGEIQPTIPINKEFDMEKFNCGTVACAIGYAPFFGIEQIKIESWFEFSNHSFIDDYKSEFNDNCWRWCFSSSWKHTDNSREGAGLRIKYLIEKGLPENWKDQMLGKAELSYLK